MAGATVAMVQPKPMGMARPRPVGGQGLPMPGPGAKMQGMKKRPVRPMPNEKVKVNEANMLNAMMGGGPRRAPKQPPYNRIGGE